MTTGYATDGYADGYSDGYATVPCALLVYCSIYPSRVDHTIVHMVPR
jgi:hypothetical protein